MKTRCTVLAVCFVLGMPFASARADSFSFGNTSGNNSLDAAIGEAQLSVDITDDGGGRVLFRFRNASPEASSISNIYIFTEDRSLLGIAYIDNSDRGVSFSQIASPGSLPAGITINPQFEVTLGFEADSGAGERPGGVDPGESVGVRFELETGRRFDDVLAELDDGRLRLGVYVEGFNTGGNESFVNDSPPVVPAPSAVLLASMGVGMVGWIRRRMAPTA